MVTKFRWFWAWHDEKEEAWLRSLSQKGWHLAALGLPGVYRFRVGEPRDYAYRLDYRTYRKNEQPYYLQLFSDAGWEHLGNMSGWQYFRKEVQPGESPEIFTDVESKVAKYKRLLVFLAIVLVPLILTSRTIWIDYPYSWWIAVRVMNLLVMGGLVYAMLRLALKIRKLSK